jgi:hypothetical protein
MGKIGLLFILFSMFSFSQTLLLEENFDYSEGQLTDENSGANVSGGNWAHHSGTSGFIQVISGSLSYSNYPSSGIGKRIEILSSQAEDVNRSFTAQSGEGTEIYASFLINVSSASTGDYFFHFRFGNSNKGRVWAKSENSGVDFGISGDDDLPVYTGDEYSLGTTHLVVVSYEFLTGADNVNLWVNPNLSGTEPLPLLTTTVGSDFTSLDKIAVRQSSNIPDCTIDGIRVADSWQQAPLPVELTSFTVSIINSQIHLNWKTSTEISNYGFDVERRNDEGEFYKIGFVKGNGNSNSEKEYEFVDKSLSSAVKYYYRLKQIDTDGSFSYSEVVGVDLASPLKYGLSQNFPNPFNPVTTIKYSLPKTGYVTLRVFNTIGEEVAILANGIIEAGIYKVVLDASGFNSGVYFYRIEAGNISQVRKMLLIK